MRNKVQSSEKAISKFIGASQRLEGGFPHASRLKTLNLSPRGGEEKQLLVSGILEIEAERTFH